MKKIILLIFISLSLTNVIAQQQSVTIPLKDGSFVTLIADKIVQNSIQYSTKMSAQRITSVATDCIVLFDPEKMILEAVVKCINDNGSNIFKARIVDGNVFEFIYSPGGNGNSVIGRGNITFDFPSTHSYKRIFQDIINCDPSDSIKMDCN